MRKKVLKDKEGSAILIAIVIMMIVTMLSLALLLVSYSLFATANKQKSTEQCKEIAQSISRELEAELTDVRFNSYQKMETALNNGESNLWFYLRFNLWQTSWPYYNEEERGHTSSYAFRYFDIEVPEEEGKDVLDDVTIKMYWESDREAVKGETTFVIQVTCKKGKQKSVITSTYPLTIEESSEYSEAGEQMIINASVNPEGNMIQTDENWIFGPPDRE